MPYLIICGEKTDYAHVLYRKAIGKYDALNFGIRFVPKDTDLVVLNDADTEIFGFKNALKQLEDKTIGLVFSKVVVKTGPQKTFYLFLDKLRSKIPIAASGELMIIRYKLLNKILPVKPCKAEDSYLLFKTLEFGYKINFCEKSFVVTERTKNGEDEVNYKRRTTTGLYQALSYTKPPAIVKLFYILLPLVSPLLLATGRKGYCWMNGIHLGFIDFLRGDNKGYWEDVSELTRAVE